MILSQIKHYVQQHKSANLQSLVVHFNSEPEAMRGMLEHWIRKGKIRKEVADCGCNGCSKCHSSGMEIYEWVV